jgi:NADPH:quinone reductase
VKAATYRRNGPPDVFEYVDVPDPVCRPNGLLVRVEAISIEGGDTLHRAGGALTSERHIVGYQCAGTVLEVGAEAGGYGVAVGDRVVATMAHGSHAELVAVPAASVWKVPEGADLISIACVPIAFGTAHDCLFEFGRLATSGSDETVLVQAAAGGVGLAAVQLAKRAGARVIGTASSPARLERVAALRYGIDHGVDYSTHDVSVEVRRITGNHGADVVVDSVGGPTLQGSLRALAYRGRCITVGQAGRDPKPIDVSVLMAGNASLTGVFLGAEMATPRARQMIADLIDDVARGDLEVIVDRTFPLEDAAGAHAYIESRQAIGRVVLLP